MERLKIYMAPLQGLTEAPYRNAFEKHCGKEWMCTTHLSSVGSTVP